MTATNHALAGVAIAIAAQRPILALPLALLSHFGLDALPHWDYTLKFPLKKYIMISDVTLAGLIVLAAAIISPAHTSAWIIMACASLAVIPDAMWLPHILKGKPIPFDGDMPLYLIRRFHRWIQWSETRQGLYIEMVWFVLVFGYIFTK